MVMRSGGGSEETRRWESGLLCLSGRRTATCACVDCDDGREVGGDD